MPSISQNFMYFRSIKNTNCLSIRLFAFVGRKKEKTRIATGRTFNCKTFCPNCGREKGNANEWLTCMFCHSFEIEAWNILSFNPKSQTMLPIKPVTKLEQMRECLRSLKQNHKVIAPYSGFGVYCFLCLLLLELGRGCQSEESIPDTLDLYRERRQKPRWGEIQKN